MRSFKVIIVSFIIFIMSGILSAQELVNFLSKDEIIISADFYAGNDNAPYILLFHDLRSSRGEFREIAPRLAKLGFNCLAVDLRSGREINFIRSETYLSTREKRVTYDDYSSIRDIQAAIEYGFIQSRKPVILMGSAYSATLSLLEGKNNKKVKSIIAFSPGEYFGDILSVKDKIVGIDKPIFAASTINDELYVKELFSKVGQNYITYFKPEKEVGSQGCKALWKEQKSATEYWMSLLLFLDKQR